MLTGATRAPNDKGALGSFSGEHPPIGHTANVGKLLLGCPSAIASGFFAKIMPRMIF